MASTWTTDEDNQIEHLILLNFHISDVARAVGKSRREVYARIEQLKKNGWDGRTDPIPGAPLPPGFTPPKEKGAIRRAAGWAGRKALDNTFKKGGFIHNVISRRLGGDVVGNDKKGGEAVIALNAHHTATIRALTDLNSKISHGLQNTTHSMNNLTDKITLGLDRITDSMDRKSYGIGPGGPKVEEEKPTGLQAVNSMADLNKGGKNMLKKLGLLGVGGLALGAGAMMMPKGAKAHTNSNDHIDPNEPSATKPNDAPDTKLADNSKDKSPIQELEIKGQNLTFKGQIITFEADEFDIKGLLCGCGEKEESGKRGKGTTSSANEGFRDGVPPPGPPGTNQDGSINGSGGATGSDNGSSGGGSGGMPPTDAMGNPTGQPATGGAGAGAGAGGKGGPNGSPQAKPGEPQTPAKPIEDQTQAPAGSGFTPLPPGQSLGGGKSIAPSPETGGGGGMPSAPPDPGGGGGSGGGSGGGGGFKPNMPAIPSNKGGGGGGIGPSKNDPSVDAAGNPTGIPESDGANDNSVQAGDPLGNATKALGDGLRAGKTWGSGLDSRTLNVDQSLGGAGVLDSNGGLTDPNQKNALDAAADKPQGGGYNKQSQLGLDTNQFTPDSSAPEGSTNDRLAASRAGLFDEVDKNPATRDLLTKGMLAEGGVKGLQANMEQVSNYAQARGMSIEQALHSGFFGPINRGQAQAHNITPAEQKASDAAYDAVRKGSNKIDYRIDQGTVGDPNYAKEQDPKYRPVRIDGSFFADHPDVGKGWAAKQKQLDQEFADKNNGSLTKMAGPGVGGKPPISNLKTTPVDPGAAIPGGFSGERLRDQKLLQDNVGKDTDTPQAKEQGIPPGNTDGASDTTEKISASPTGDGGMGGSSTEGLKRIEVTGGTTVGGPQQDAPVQQPQTPNNADFLDKSEQGTKTDMQMQQPKINDDGGVDSDNSAGRGSDGVRGDLQGNDDDMQTSMDDHYNGGDFAGLGDQSSSDTDTAFA